MNYDLGGLREKNVRLSQKTSVASDSRSCRCPWAAVSIYFPIARTLVRPLKLRGPVSEMRLPLSVLYPSLQHNTRNDDGEKTPDKCE
ncbi:hypothetical protein EVAR_30394_1 [Eumeta japonica]|uniref:Uncharacterized protein n=1 Tax=Eumeta variegata TaxID=151549 RepID=A0A4C1W7Z6_EUMVA|nr:hypothetical protein EVAR_30394_1 [Eumeta japonica]